jgi:hypothetical protein
MAVHESRRERFECGHLLLAQGRDGIQETLARCENETGWAAAQHAGNLRLGRRIPGSSFHTVSDARVFIAFARRQAGDRLSHDV